MSDDTTPAPADDQEPAEPAETEAKAPAEPEPEAPPFSNPSPDSEAQPDPDKEINALDAASQGVPVVAPADLVAQVQDKPEASDPEVSVQGEAANAAFVSVPSDDPENVVVLIADGRIERVAPGEPIPSIRANAVRIEVTAEVFAENVDWFNRDLISALSPYAHVTVDAGPVLFNPQVVAFFLP